MIKMDAFSESSTYEYLKDFYGKKGLTVLNSNDAGFPDLIALNGKDIAFFVEVKQGFNFHSNLREEQFSYHTYLRQLGFDVKILFFNMNNRCMEYATRTYTKMGVRNSSYGGFRPSRHSRFSFKRIQPFSVDEIISHSTKTDNL